MGGPNHILQHDPSENPTQNPTTGPPPFGVMVWYGMVMWQYDCQPWLMAFRPFYMYEGGSGMSMKWM